MDYELNKYGVPHKSYEITLADGSEKIIDIGVEEDWGNVQPMTPDENEVFAKCKRGTIPDDWDRRYGWGNDADGHIEIVDVYDIENEDHLDVAWWVKNEIDPYSKCYGDI